MAFYTDFPVYPTEILNITDYPNQVNNVNDVLANLVNALRDEVIAIQAELGTVPKAGYADVKARLATFGTGDMSYANTRFTVTDGTRDMAAASGDVVYTGVPFTPAAIKLNCSISGDARASWGFCDTALVQKCLAQLTADTMEPHFDRIIFINDGAGNNQAGVIKSFNSNGCTITWTKGGNPVGTLYLELFYIR